jgi:DNA-binding CsgD family transcriptional regulator
MGMKLEPPAAVRAALDSRRARGSRGRGCPPVVWLRGIAGTGKSELLRRLRCDKAVTLDNPTPAKLRGALANKSRAMVVASRPSTIADHELLSSRMYGDVVMVEDPQLFFTAEECDQRDAGLFAASAGWPMLVGAYMRGQADEISKLLPEFLLREVLPTLPDDLVAALFAALVEPLSEAAILHLFPAHAQLHPLLRKDGRLASTWVSEALAKVSTRPGAISETVAQRLTEIHSTFGNPVKAICALNAIGRPNEAITIFERQGGAFFGFRHGFSACEEALRSFPPDFRLLHESLQLARQFFYIKTGQTGEALRQLESGYPQLPVDLRRMVTSHGAYPILFRLEHATDVDEAIPVDVIRSWGRLESHFRTDDYVARGMLYNTMTLALLTREDDLSEARQVAEEALSAYQKTDCAYLSHSMCVHLADIAIRQGFLKEAGQRLRSAQENLNASGVGRRSDAVAIQLFLGRLTYELGKISECEVDLAATLTVLVEGESWPGLIRGMLNYVPFVVYWRNGLRAALEAAQRCMLTLGRKHGLRPDRRLVLVRVRLNQLGRRHDDAVRLLAELDTTDMPEEVTPQLWIEEALIRLRCQVALFERASEPVPAVSRALSDSPHLSVRQQITLAVLQAMLWHKLGQDNQGRRQMALALRLARDSELIGVLIEEAEFLERLLPLFILTPGTGGDVLVPFARKMVALLRELPFVGLNSRETAGVSPREHRVLLYLADGATNKTIARALSISESAIKFHVRNLLRKLGAVRRGDLITRAREIGLLA